MRRHERRQWVAAADEPRLFRGCLLSQASECGERIPFTLILYPVRTPRVKIPNLLHRLLLQLFRMIMAWVVDVARMYLLCRRLFVSVADRHCNICGISACASVVCFEILNGVYCRVFKKIYTHKKIRDTNADSLSVSNILSVEKFNMLFVRMARHMVTLIRAHDT